MENKKIEKPHLILNFDINQTIILGDQSKNLDLESGVKSCIVDYAWGIYNKSLKKWTLTENYLSYKRPKQNLENYNYYMDQIYPLKTEKEIPDNEERYKKNNEIKKYKENLFQEFLDKDKPGEKLYYIYLDIIKKLKISDNIMKKINQENSKYPPFYKQLYKNGYIFIFPSLFRLMIELQNANRAFTIIFRTFGNDFDNVIKEYNSFCEGNHPIFSGERGNEKYPKKYFNGTNNSNDYRIKENNIGIFYRFDEKINNICLVLGTLQRINVKNFDELFSFYEEQMNKKKINIIKGGKKIYEYMINSSSVDKINSFCINDHYETWFKYDKKSICGKPMLIDPENKNVEIFFFDDNITNSDKSIVDCRNINTGDIIESKDIKEKYLLTTDTLKAAEDENYYLNFIKQAEK